MDLHTRRENIEGFPCVSSAWQPDEHDLAALNSGAYIVMTIVGNTMPPGRITVGNATCAVCELRIEPGMMCYRNPQGLMEHEKCAEIKWAGMSDREREAYTKETLSGAAMESVDHSNCREYAGILARAVRYLNAQLTQFGGHTKTSRQIVRGALREMNIQEGYEPETDEFVKIKTDCLPQFPQWIERDSHSPKDHGWYTVKNHGWYTVKNLDGSLSARLWEDGMWWNANVRNGITPNISITHWRFDPEIHGSLGKAPDFSKVL